MNRLKVNRKVPRGIYTRKATIMEVTALKEQGYIKSFEVFKRKRKFSITVTPSELFGKRVIRKRSVPSNTFDIATRTQFLTFYTQRVNKGLMLMVRIS